MIVCSPGRNFVTLKIETEGGVYGLGDATLNGRELAVASYLTDHVIPLLIGRDARRIEDIWHYLYKGAYWRRGPVTMTAIAAVDTALWDIKGKALGVPVYQLLGGQARDDVMVYGHANGEIDRRDGGGGGRIRAPGLQGGAPAVRRARRRERVRRRARQAALRAGREGQAAGDVLVDGEIPERRAGAVRARAARAGPGRPPAARRPPPADADRGGAPRARRWSRITCSGWRTRCRRSCRRASG